MARRSSGGGALAGPALLLALCAAAACLLDGGAALHLCTDRLFNDTQDRHIDGLPHLNPTEEATSMNLMPLRAGASCPRPPSLRRQDRPRRIDDASMYWQGQQTNLEYLLYLDPDGLTWTSAYSQSMVDSYEQLADAWSAYYTIHKIMQRLLDTLAGNPKGLEMAVWMTDYFSNRVKNLIQEYSIQRHWEAINEETGGLNDVLYHLYTITKEQKYLILAHLFDKPCFLGPLGLHMMTYRDCMLIRMVLYSLAHRRDMK